jgi:hypothetical protein
LFPTPLPRRCHPRRTGNFSSVSPSLIKSQSLSLSISLYKK